MLKGTITIHKKQRLAYFPKHLVESGYEGEVPCLIDAAAIVLIKPGIEVEHAIRSLRIIIRDLELRRDLGETSSSAKGEKTPPAKGGGTEPKPPAMKGTEPKRLKRLEGTEPISLQTRRSRRSTTTGKGGSAK